jgi:hypothetical protein
VRKPRLGRRGRLTEPEPIYAAGADSVPRAGLLPSPRVTRIALGAGRIALGGAFLASPKLSVRVLGLDSATAGRVTWLARMTAGRDIALGVGTLVSSVRGAPSAAGWVVAGAAADAVDAVVIAQGVQDRRLGGIGAVGLVGGAAAAALVGFWAAARR